MKYVGEPDRPTSVGLVTSEGVVCETDPHHPQISTDPTPQLGARAQTKPGGQNEAKLRVYFDIDKHHSDGTWTDVNPGNGQRRPGSGYVGDGTWTSLSWSELEEGPLYRYRAFTESYWDNGSKHLGSKSNASGKGWCHFTVDPTAPAAPQLAMTAPYQECQPNDCPAAGGPGTSTTITATPAAEDTVTAGRYWNSVTEEWSPMTADGGGFSADITPDSAGTVRIAVELKDEAGRWGERGLIDFLVKAGEGPIARWHFDEASGAATDSATAADSARQDATLYGGAARDDRGRRGVLTHDTEGNPLPEPVTDRGLDLDGSTGYASTDGPVLETRAAYTVAAWVRLDNKTDGSIVLSQDGDHYSPFILSYESKYQAWYFGVKESAEDTGDAYWGQAAEKEAVAGVWTHIAGTYSPADQELRLYINGKLDSTATVPGSWNSAGGLQIGRYLWEGNHYFNFNGSIDEVAVWQRELTAAEIGDEARLLTSDDRAGVELVAAWDPAAGSGTTVPDVVSGYGRDLTLAGGATLDGEALALDGTSGHATAAGPPVDNSGSFTTTTYLEPDADKLASAGVGDVVQVLEQPAADGSSWGIWFEVTEKRTIIDDDFNEKTVAAGLWHFGRPGSAVASEAPTVIDGSGVRLTGVHDAPSGTVTLYVTDEQQDMPAVYTAKAGEGGLMVGRSAAGDYMPGRIFDIRIWAGAVAGQEQLRETIGE